MFTEFEESDFKSLDGTKKASELKSTTKKLFDFKNELDAEIFNRWSERFTSRIGGTYPPGKMIDNLYVAFTQRNEASYTQYPQLNIGFEEDIFEIFFVLYGHKYPNLKQKQREVSKQFNSNFVKNVSDNLSVLNLQGIDIDDADLNFEKKNFHFGFKHEISEVTNIDKKALMDLIFSDWVKLKPLYDMAMNSDHSSNPDLVDVVEYKFRRYSNSGHIEFVTFHPSYSYEEFVEGIKPKTDDNGNISYNVEDGIFKNICKKASEPERSGQPHILIIDEINRGNISKIFGELITLLEPDKRIGAEHEICVKLPYSKKKFGVPQNVHIIGTMNTADRSIALMDIALRRRFSFVEYLPDFKEARNGVKPSKGDIVDLSILALENINETIRTEYAIKLGKDKQIGHSFVFKMGSVDGGNTSKEDNVRMIWRYEILPLLEEYFFGRYDDMKNILGDKGDELIDTQLKRINDFTYQQLKNTLQTLTRKTTETEQ